MKGEDEVSSDKLFKTAIRYFLGDLLELVDPELAAALDLTAPDYLAPEVFKDFQKAGHLVPDVVARVSTREGQPRLVLVHVEVEDKFLRETEDRLRLYALHLELELRYPVITVVVYLRGGPRKGVELRRVSTVIGTREISSFSYVAFGLSRSLAEDYVDRPQPLAAALAALMRSRLWDKVEQKLFCLEAVSRARLPLAQEYVLAKVVKSRIELSPEDERRFQELVRERGEEVEAMAVTWEEALAEREAIGAAKGLAEGEAKGLAEGEAKGKLIATRQAITLLAKHCFRSLPAGFEEQLEAIDDLGRLYEILEQVHEARSVGELSI
jgi:hypothetical protein